MATCVYCGEDKKPSREHIFSNALLRLFEDVAPLTFDSHRSVVHKGDPIIRDICIACNSSLSGCDTEMTRVASKYLKQVIRRGTTLEFNSQLILRWLVKTASNITRAAVPKTGWWHGYIPFILDRGDALPHIDALFSPWVDLSPYGIAEKLGMIHCIESRNAILTALRAGSSRRLREQIEFCHAIKISYGVFLLLVWHPTADVQMRVSVRDELLQYGWQDIDAVTSIERLAYNTSSSTNFNVIADPNKNISDAIDADTMAIANGA